MIDLFIFEDYLSNCAANLELVEEGCDLITNEVIRIAAILAEAGVDGIIISDDSALQDRPMMSMKLFRRIFIPRFTRFYSAAHALGMDTRVHSCGYTLDIIEEFIRAGAKP